MKELIKMPKANTQFKLTIRDIEIIEQALRAKAGRRGLAIANGETSDKLKEEMHEIQNLLGRLHDQKVWYTPKDKFVPGG
jgi:hypothetical protein